MSVESLIFRKFSFQRTHDGVRLTFHDQATGRLDNHSREIEVKVIGTDGRWLAESLARKAHHKDVDGAYEGHARSEAGATSRSAAKMTIGSAGSVRRHIYELIRRYGKGGMTDDELEEMTRLSHQSVSARRRELVQGGHVVDSGQRRHTRRGRKATVWTVP